MSAAAALPAVLDRIDALEKTRLTAPKREQIDELYFTPLALGLALLAIALIFTPAVIELLAPGFNNDATRFPLAVTLTRITFPYLLLMTMVTLFSGILNSLERFAAAARRCREGGLDGVEITTSSSRNSNRSHRALSDVRPR